MKKIIIIWAWLHAEVVRNIISYNSNNNFIWYLDDNKTWSEIIWKIEEFIKYRDNVYFICGIWDNSVREDIFNKIKLKWWKFINAIHPKAYIEKWVILGEWIVIWANSYINIWSEIWDNTIINNGVIIEHHNKIWKHCHLAPWVVTWWSVILEDNIFVWIWTNIINNIFIWKNIFIWAWSLIHKNIKEKNVKVFWVPFKYR